MLDLPTMTGKTFIFGNFLFSLHEPRDIRFYLERVIRMLTMINDGFTSSSFPSKNEESSDNEISAEARTKTLMKTLAADLLIYHPGTGQTDEYFALTFVNQCAFHF